MRPLNTKNRKEIKDYLAMEKYLMTPLVKADVEQDCVERSLEGN